MNDTDAVEGIQARLTQIYGVVNKRLSEAEMFNRLDENAGYLARMISEEREPEKWLIGSLSWLFAIANKLEIDVQDAVLRKYPTICHYCLERQCLCETTLKTPLRQADRPKELYGNYNTVINQLSLRRVEATLDYFVDLLSTLYPGNVARWRLNRFEIVAKLGEERAEILEAYRRFVVTSSKENKTAIAEEVADYFAWLLAIWHLSHRNLKGYSVQRVFTATYKFGCPYCNGGVCKCEKETQYGVRSDAQLETATYEPDILKKLVHQLREIVEEIESHDTKGVDREALKRIMKDPEKQKKQDLVASLTDAQKALTAIEKSSGSIGSIASKFKGLIEWVAMYWPS